MADADWGDEVRVLAKALDQAGDVLDQVHPDALSQPTPCGDWDVAALADHLIAAPGRFLTMMRGGQPDWAAPPAHVAEGWGPAFRVAGDDLIHAWHEGVAAAPASADWQTAEIAVHTWDLATAIGVPVDRLEPEVAARGGSRSCAPTSPPTTAPRRSAPSSRRPTTPGPTSSSRRSPAVRSGERARTSYVPSKRTHCPYDVPRRARPPTAGRGRNRLAPDP